MRMKNAAVRPLRVGLGVATLVVAVSCIPSNTTTRIVDGRRIAGRAVPPPAYADYLRGIHQEAQGKLFAALKSYEEAADDDPYSPELWTRIGALRCLLDPDEFEDADDAFQRAEELDPQYGPLWREVAVCARSIGHNRHALSAARRAVASDPDSVEATVLLSEVLADHGRFDEAERWLFGFAMRFPKNRVGLEALLAFAHERGHQLNEHLALRKLQQLHSRRTNFDLPSAHAQDSELPSGSDPCALSTILDCRDARQRHTELRLNHAIREGDLIAARHFASLDRVSATELAYRLLDQDQPQLALEQARLVSRADPRNTDARIALLAAATYLTDDAAFHDALQGLEMPGSRPSRAALAYLIEVLELRGEEVAAARVRRTLQQSDPQRQNISH